MDVSQQIGPAPDSSSHPAADTCPLVSLELLDLGGPVSYPSPSPSSPPPVKADVTIEDLDYKTRYAVTQQMLRQKGFLSQNNHNI